jgi:serine/threonine protein kinase
MKTHPDVPDADTWKRISPLLDEALDLPESERAAWLAELRARLPQDAAVLEGLLARQETARREDFLGGAAQPAPALPGAGHHLGPWTIEAPLGESGMASVWLARRSDGRHDGQAAIKLMHGRLHGTQASQRFEREGRILARLEHPHIARLLDAGVAGDGEGGQPYLVLELVRGEPIDRWCDQRQLDVEARLRLFVDVVQAVAAAHAQLVVHRDLKPGNVMVDGQGQVKLLDFGIARLLDEGEDGAAPSAASITRTGQRAFTPAWAAPEQMRGESVSTTTDVWALGVLLCQLLTGRHASGLPWTSDLTAWMQAAASPDIKRPSQLAGGGEDAVALAAARGLQPQDLARRLHGELDQIVQRALAEEPSRRYGSAQALADDVMRHLRNEPVSAVADTVGYRATKFVRRNRLMVGAASATVLALLAGVVGTTWQALEARAQRDAAQSARAEAVAQAERAERERMQAVKQLDRAEAMNDLMAYALGPVSDKPLSVLDVLKRGEVMVDKQFQDAPDLQTFMKIQLAGYWSHGKELDRMVSLLQSARVTAQRTGDIAALTSIECKLSFIDTEKGDFDLAHAKIEQALAALHGEQDEALEARAACLRRRADTHQEQGRTAQALTDIDAALALTPSPRRGQIAARLDLQATRASILGEMGQLGPAVRAYEALFSDLRQRGVFDATAQSATLNNFYIVLTRAGQMAKALETIEQGLLLGKGPGATRGSTWIERGNRAYALTLLGRAAEALPTLEGSMADARRSGEPRHIGYRAFIYAEALCAVGRWAECKKYQELSATTLGAILASSHPVLGRLAVSKARLALAQGSTAGARTELVKALAIFDASKLPESWRIEALILIARADVQDRRFDAALRSAEDAVALSREVFKDFPQSHRGGNAYLELGRVYLARGDKARAREALMQALSQYKVAMGPTSVAAREVSALLATL